MSRARRLKTRESQAEDALAEQMLDVAAFRKLLAKNGRGPESLEMQESPAKCSLL
jgi:hypothetical protein